MEYQEDLLKAISEIVCTDNSGKAQNYHELVNQIVAVLRDLREARGRLYFIGNGGSAAIAIHMTGDFFSNGRILTHSMHDSATITCLANDFSYDEVFSRQVALIGDIGDMLVAISSSGRSPNILNAVQVAKEKQVKVLTLSGFATDNPLRQMGEWNFYVPCLEYGKVETIHNMILQEIVDKLLE